MLDDQIISSPWLPSPRFGLRTLPGYTYRDPNVYTASVDSIG